MNSFISKSGIVTTASSRRDTTSFLSPFSPLPLLLLKNILHLFLHIIRSLFSLSSIHPSIASLYFIHIPNIYQVFFDRYPFYSFVIPLTHYFPLKTWLETPKKLSSSCLHRQRHPPTRHIPLTMQTSNYTRLHWCSSKISIKMIHLLPVLLPIPFLPKASLQHQMKLAKIVSPILFHIIVLHHSLSFIQTSQLSHFFFFHAN